MGDLGTTYREGPPRQSGARAGRQSDGAYYTPAAGAVSVAAHAVGGGRCLGDSVRIVDPACGDGALLEACARTLPARPASGPRGRDALTGYDIDPAAVEAARKAVAGAAPGLRTAWRTSPRGGTTGRHLAGALDILAGRGGPLFADPERGAHDVVVMNPPFTRNEVRAACGLRRHPASERHAVADPDDCRCRRGAHRGTLGPGWLDPARSGGRWPGPPRGGRWQFDRETEAEGGRHRQPRAPRRRPPCRP